MRTGWLVAVVVCLGTVLTAQGIVAADDLAKSEAKLRSLLVDKLGDDASGIRVTLLDNKAILTGRVTRRSTQELAKEVALFFAGVTKVDNQVEGPKQGGLGKGLIRREAGDAELEASVKKHLRKEIGDHAGTIEVEAVEGVVSLRGEAPEAARRDIALKTAAGVEGVVKVVDLIRIAR